MEEVASLFCAKKNKKREERLHVNNIVNMFVLTILLNRIVYCIDMENKNKEQDILRAAEQEFLQKGYDGAKTVSIARAAGVTHAMLHYYFRTKENLFNRVFEEKLKLMSESIINVFSESRLPLLERIRTGMERHFDFMVQNPDLPRFVINEIASNPERRDLIGKRIEAVTHIAMHSLQLELDHMAEKGLVEKMSVMDLIIDIMSLNVYVFIAYPMIETFVLNGQDREAFFASRKKENVEIIMRRLKKE